MRTLGINVVQNNQKSLDFEKMKLSRVAYLHQLLLQRRKFLNIFKRFSSKVE